MTLPAYDPTCLILPVSAHAKPVEISVYEDDQRRILDAAHWEGYWGPRYLYLEAIVHTLAALDLLRQLPHPVHPRMPRYVERPGAPRMTGMPPEWHRFDPEMPAAGWGGPGFDPRTIR